jgi:D-inositol-3-phosphate glycosyltransferase
MIHFVWSSIYPLIPGTGGSEVYTVGQVRELLKRGIDCEIVTVGHGKKDGRNFFPDIKFRNIRTTDIAKLEGTCIFVSQALDVKTKKQSYVILHCPPPVEEWEREIYTTAIKGKKIIVTSYAAAEAWANYFQLMRSEISVVYPFADVAFSTVEQKSNVRPTILFAGRLNPAKGVYNLLATMHDKRLTKYDFKFVKASAHTPEGKIILKLLKVHPRVKLIEARDNPKQMAELLAGVDVLVMPTSSQLFMETFGMLSIEAQHAGCRVVASNCGGLPETNVGGLSLVEPDNSVALANGIVEAVKTGRLKPTVRKKIRGFFTLVDSVDNLLRAIGFTS